MANFKEHLVKGGIAGCLAGSGYYIYLHNKANMKHPNLKDDLINIIAYTLLGGLTGCLAGILPDKLEPPSNPNHRKFFHSIAFYSILGGLIFKLLTRHNISSCIKTIAFAGLAGYGSHILLDSKTPKSIQLI